MTVQGELHIAGETMYVNVESGPYQIVCPAYYKR